MRNWNIWNDFTFPLVFKSFYSTYEELKLSHVLVINSYIVPVFTVPMRNWNVLVLKQFQRLYNSFYSTYEELKRHELFITDEKPCRFLQYLWGIETCLCERKRISDYKFLQYLWGIETFVIHTKNFCFPFVFTVPMRNWNASQGNSVIFSIP